MIYDDETMRKFMKWRGVEFPCQRCRGAGVYHYGHGSTWRGGMGTASGAWDVCNVCWGTGDEHRHGVNLREQQDEETKRIAKRAGELLADSVGANFGSTEHAIRAIADELEKLSRGRKERPRFFYDLCASLVKTFRAMVV